MINTETIAVIDIGSSAIRLLIAQGGPTHWRLLDSAELPLAMGRDVFRSGNIEHRTMNRAVEILRGFLELMKPYSVNRIVAIGTSALRESENRELFVDRVLLQTGIEIRVIDGIEANQLTWLAVREPLEEAISGFKRHNSVIIEVGAGNTELMLLKQGKISKAHALPIGTLRFLQQLNQPLGAEMHPVRNFFRNHTYRIVKTISQEMDLARVSKLVAIGSDARLVASRLGRAVNDEMAAIPGEKFRNFMKEIEVLSLEEIVDFLNLPWNEAELLFPALVILNTFLESTRADEILVPSAGIRQGLLISYASGGDSLRTIFGTQVLAGARSLAKHYRNDIKHADFVRKQASILYDALTKDLGLKGYHRIFLETAAILHDVGSFIAGTGHHKHSQYIVRNSDIFGLSSTDKDLVGHIVRYHRRAKPSRSHSLYMNLSRSQRIVVQKLAALLRVADALDRSHTQQTAITRLLFKEEQLIIYTSHPGDISLEKLSLEKKGDLFEDIFGLRPVLRSDDSGSNTE